VIVLLNPDVEALGFGLELLRSWTRTSVFVAPSDDYNVGDSGATHATMARDAFGK
jgi:hypothetical protein